MAPQLVPTDPEKVMAIRRLVPEILICSTPFKRFGRIQIGGRGTIVKLQSGSLAVFSPVALTETVKKEMDALSPGAPVRYLTALDQEHHIFLEAWHKAYPQAKIIVPEPLPAYRDKQNYFKLPEENLAVWNKGNAKHDFKVSEEFDQEFDMEYVDAHANQELVFNHKPTKTLIEADLIFNLPAIEQMSMSPGDTKPGLLTKLFNTLNTTRGSATWQKRFIWYGTSSSDRRGFNESIRRINGWDFDKLIPCHGEVIETGAKDVFAKIMAWHLQAGKESA